MSRRPPLTLDTVQSLEQLLLFIDRSHNVQTIIFENVFHERTVIPDKTALLVGKLATSLLQTCGYWPTIALPHAGSPSSFD
jgi:hypothetical protein